MDRIGLPRGRSALLAIAIALLLVAPVHAAEGSWSTGTGTIVYGVAARADGSLVVAGRRDNTVAAYDATGNLLWTFATQGTVYDVAVSDVGCLQGAADALALDDDALVSSVLFDDPVAADDFITAWHDEGRTVVGTAPVRTYCLD